MKRELKRIHINGCRWNERIKSKPDGSKSLAYTGLRGDLEHLTIETRLIGETDVPTRTVRFFLCAKERFFFFLFLLVCYIVAPLLSC